MPLADNHPEDIEGYERLLVCPECDNAVVLGIDPLCAGTPECYDCRRDMEFEGTEHLSYSSSYVPETCPECGGESTKILGDKDWECKQCSLEFS